MTPEGKQCVEKHKKQMEGALVHLEKELTKIRAGKATPQMLQSVMVDYYGTITPIEQLGSITTPDPKQIVVQPWEKNLLKEIEKAIVNANLGLTPSNTGDLLRIMIPPITEERRRDLVKKAKEECEKGRVAVRNIRRDANEEAKKLEKTGLSEDDIKSLEKEIQDMTNKFIDQVEKIFEAKEKDILTV